MSELELPAAEMSNPWSVVNVVLQRARDRDFEQNQ
jgi:hypothetical protein